MLEKYLDIIKRKFNVKLDLIMNGKYYFSSDEVCICVIEPHQSTNYQYLLRADFPQIFDKWSNSSFQSYFDLDSFGNVIIELNHFVKNEKDEIIRSKLDE